MERFDYGISHEQQYAAYRADPAWIRIYRLLRQGYWHGTTAKNWMKIKKAGEISPNKGQFKSVWDGITERSYAYLRQYVALFDFFSPTEEEVIQSWEHAWGVLSEYDVLLRFNRQKLNSKIVRDSEAIRVGGCIIFVEVWYPTSIPLSSVAQAYRITCRDGFELEAEMINTDDVVKTRRHRHKLRKLPDNWDMMTCSEAVQYLMNAGELNRPELKEKCPDLFEKNNLEDPVERAIRNAGIDGSGDV